MHACMGAGVSYIRADELPGATLLIADTNLAIEDSSFTGLSFFGQGALVLAHSNVTFLNVTFAANNNSAGIQRAVVSTALDLRPTSHCVRTHACMHALSAARGKIKRQSQGCSMRFIRSLS